MKIPGFDLYCIRRQITGVTLNGEVDKVSEPIRPLVHRLNRIKASKERQHVLDGFLLGRDDKADVEEALAGVDPDGPAPEIDEQGYEDPATVDDLLSETLAEEWIWDRYFGTASLVGIFGFEGLGKTLFGLDFCIRAHLGLLAPDGQPLNLPQGTQFLWICADGNHDELARRAEQLGAKGAIVFNGTKDDRYGFTDLDEAETLERLEANLAHAPYGMVFIDTLTNATARNLCSQAEVTALMKPLRDLAKKYQTTIALNMHSNRDGNVLGRRLRGWCRTILKIEEPDEENPGQLKLAVFKSHARKPAPIGMAIGDDGVTYTAEPPPAPAKAKGGRPSSASGKAKDFIVGLLTQQNDRGFKALVDEVVAGAVASKGTAFSTIEALEAEGRITIDRERRPQVIHLNGQATEDDDVRID